MLSAEKNERLTRARQATPTGEPLRRPVLYRGAPAPSERGRRAMMPR